MQDLAPSPLASACSVNPSLNVLADASLRELALESQASHANILYFTTAENLTDCLSKFQDNARILVILPDHRRHDLPTKPDQQRLNLLHFPEMNKEFIRHFYEIFVNQNNASIVIPSDELNDRQKAGQSFSFSESWSRTEAVFTPPPAPCGAYDNWNGHQLCSLGGFSWRLPETAHAHFALDGTLCLKGSVIVDGDDAEERDALYASISPLAESPIFLRIQQGRIIGITAAESEPAPPLDVLNALIAQDPSYCLIQAVGFALNKDASPYPANTALNGGCGRPGGALFLEIGNAGTKHRLRLFCSDTLVSCDGDTLLGKKKMMRRKSAACPCLNF